MLATKWANLSWIPWENQHPQVVLWSPHMQYHMQNQLKTHTINKLNRTKKNLGYSGYPDPSGVNIMKIPKCYTSQLWCVCVDNCLTFLYLHTTFLFILMHFYPKFCLNICIIILIIVFFILNIVFWIIF